MMRVDEAIKHCDLVAEIQEWMANCHDDDSMGKKMCVEFAKENRQISELLRELKIYRDGGLKGKWNVKDGGYECNQCGYEFIADDTDDFRFCPWCGAKMGGDVDEIKS